MASHEEEQSHTTGQQIQSRFSVQQSATTAEATSVAKYQEKLGKCSEDRGGCLKLEQGRDETVIRERFTRGRLDSRDGTYSENKASRARSDQRGGMKYYLR